MSFNLFTSPNKDDIRVGYIDPTLGYLDGVTICEANEYAKNNPGTTFIFRDGNNNFQYLNINEVNSLNPNNLTSTQGECGGIQQYKECGPPRIQFFGGGGIGAAGNPIIGRDGSLLAVDLVRGGHGYQYAPIVAARDDCQFGNGAVLTAILGETADQTEVFEGEEDFEEYELCEDTDVGYGKIYSPDGQELGDWDPTAYTQVSEDPIRREIEIYQKLLESPFWTTRKNKPDRITALGKKYPNSYNVNRPEWGEFMNKYGISPVKPSDTTGTDESGKIFAMEWEQNFPITGEYVFRGVCDKRAQVYVDDKLIGSLKGAKQDPSPFQATILEGNHIVKIDLLNLPLPYKFRQGSNDTNSSVLGATAIRNALADGLSPAQIEEEAARQGLPLNENAKEFLRSASTSSSTVISSASWNENPMGVSMIIEPPQPVIPQEPLPVQTGKCPPNPIWSTRFPNSSQKWHPVRNTSFSYKFRQGPNDTNPGVLGATAIRNALADGLSPAQIEREASKQGYPLNENAKAVLRSAATSSKSKGSQSQEDRTWSKFMNRYAVSPVPPLDTPGSDSSGSLFSNTWEIDLPYSGFYGVKGTRDNNAKVLIDNILVSTLDTYSSNNPTITKIFLAKGKHIIQVEVSNDSQETTSTIETKVFSTQDWRVTSSSKSTIDVDFNYKTAASSTLASYFRISDLGIDIFKPTRTGLNQNISKKVEVGKVYTIEFEVPNTSGSVTITAQGNTLIVEDLKSGSDRDLFLTVNNGKFFDIQNGKTKATCKFTVDEGGNSTPQGVSGNTKKGGVTYQGPELFGYKDSRWSQYMNNKSVSPKVFSSINSPDSNVVGKYTLTWKNVRFPEDGIYKFNFQADNNATFKVGGKTIYKTNDFNREKVQYNFNATAGKYDVVVELENTKIDEGGEDQFIFEKNPMGVSLTILKDISLSETSKTSWVENPMAVSAILIPPPCAKKIGGKGVIEKVIVQDPGNGYLPPAEQGPGYPATLVLDEVIVENPGINYRCGEDQIRIIPDNGAQLTYDCDPFGKIRSVKVLNPGVGFNVYPEISIPSETGVNASFRPVFRVLRDPLLPPEKLIQVTDLVGLKQTGYVDGRAYYGAVYYDEGIAYAGYYKTAGPQTRIYTTLQESITARVTTQPNAIQRSGTDVTSNDPRLNIPGTIQSTEET